MNREEFEKLPEIAELLNDKEKGFFYNEDFDVYGTNPVNDFDAGFINGAWYAYQHQQKKIDEELKHLKIPHYGYTAAISSVSVAVRELEE